MPLTRSPDAVITELHDGTGVVLHLGANVYFTLNATGVLVWKMLESPVADEAELARRLSERFPEVAPMTVAADVTALVAELEREGLVKRDGA